MIAFQIFYLHVCRSLNSSLRTVGIFTNRIVFLGIGAVIMLQAVFMFLTSGRRAGWATDPLASLSSRRKAVVVDVGGCEKSGAVVEVGGEAASVVEHDPEAK